MSWKFNPFTGNLDYTESSSEAETDPLSLHIDQTTPQSIINGRPTFTEGMLLGTNPTIGAFTEGKIYYDAMFKTVTAEIDDDISLQIGQEEIRRVYNNSGSQIDNGSAVYTTGVYSGGTNDVVTVGLAKADAYATSFVLGLATQDIPDSSYGFITVRGHINNVKTDYAGWTAGDVLYLSADTAGILTNVLPTPPYLQVRVGRAITINATTGRINVRLNNVLRLQDLADSSMGTITDGMSVVREGSLWIAKDISQVSAGAGVTVYLNPTVTVDNYQSLLRVPNLTAGEQTASVLVNTATVGATLRIMGFLYNQAENRTKWDGGTWTFNTYCYASTATGTNQIISSVHNVQTFGGTATVTGSGTSRTCAVSGYTGTPFVAGDANADMTLSGYVQTAGGTFQITAYTSASEVTIATPSGYSNEAGVAFTVYKYKFQTTTGDIQQIITPILVTKEITEGEIALKDLTDTIAITYFGRTNSAANRTLYLVYNSSTNGSNVKTPLQQRHDELAGLNLTGSNYMHLTTAQHTVATQAATVALNGYLSSTDWGTFNGKQSALTFGIADTNAVQINAADVADNDYAKFTATGLEGRSYSEVLSDIGAAAASHTAQHAVGGTDTVFPADPGSDKYLMWDDDPGQLVWVDVAGGGTVTSVSVVTANGVSGSVATETTTPAITLTLGVITPTSVNGLTLAAQAVGFTIAGGTTSKTLTVDSTVSTSGLAATTLANLASVAINTTLVSDTDNTDALGTAAIGWSDLFLGNESVITWSSAPSTADVTLTHSANTLSFAGASSGYNFDNLVHITTSTTSLATLLQLSNDGQNANTGSAIDFLNSTAGATPIARISATVGASYANNVLSFDVQGSTKLTLNKDGVLAPGTNDSSVLGTTSLMWSDLFLASGAVINFNAGDVTITHSANDLNITGGTVTLNNLAGTGARHVMADANGLLSAPSGFGKIIQFSRVTSTASGTVAYTGVGFKPSAIVAMWNDNAAAAPWFGMGFVGSDLTQDASFQDFAGNSNSVGGKMALVGESGVNYTLVNLDSFDTDGFTITYTKVGSPTGTAAFTLMCFR